MSFILNPLFQSVFNSHLCFQVIVCDETQPIKLCEYVSFSNSYRMLDTCVFEMEDLLARISFSLYFDMSVFWSSVGAGQPHKDRTPLSPPTRYSEQRQK